MIQKKYTLKRLNDNIVGKRVIYENKFSINYQNALNPAQFEAASAVDGAYLIIAGAGTGKTRTLVYRVARLVELGFDPKSILLLTFTRKAANEMMNRAAVLLDNRCSKILGGTFHSFANLTLRKYYKALNLDSSFTILDQGDSEDVINLIRSQVEFITKEKRFPNKQTLNKVFSLSVNTGKSVEDIIEESYPHFLDEHDKILGIKKVFSEYKRKNNLLDYDDLLVYLKNFLHDLSPSAKSLLSSIKFVMVDEYQDTNKLQAEVVLGLTQLNKNIMVVGDDSQSIYSFRGANFKNIIEFPILFPDTKIIKLEENYRSVQPVLDFTNKIIEGAVEKYEKHLYTRRTGGDLPFIVAASTENLQSKFIVDKILDLREEGVPLKDIAVLFRSSFFSFDLEIELNKANLDSQTSFRYNDTIAKLFQLLYQLHTKQALPSEKAQLVVDYYYPIFNEKYDDFNKRKKDLDIFLNITENYKSLDSLLADMAIEPIIDSVIDIEATDKEEEYVTLSTIHSAKGLEWHSVFIIHAVEGFFPSSRSVENLDTLEEERRLMYVASTRAKQNLFVTYSYEYF